MSCDWSRGRHEGYRVAPPTSLGAGSLAGCHRHGSAETNHQAAKYINVSALDLRHTVRPRCFCEEIIGNLISIHPIAPRLPVTRLLRAVEYLSLIEICGGQHAKGTIGMSFPDIDGRGVCRQLHIVVFRIRNQHALAAGRRAESIIAKDRRSFVVTDR